jgi:GT2 family glycosyltransferase
MRLLARPAGNTVYEALIPGQLRGRWCRISIRLPRQSNHVLTQLRLQSSPRPEAPGEEITLFPPSHPVAVSHMGLGYIPGSTEVLRLSVFGLRVLPDSIVVALRPIPRPVAALLAARRTPGRLLGMLRGGWRGLPGRLRAALAVPPPAPAVPYGEWAALFDTWTPAQTAALLQSANRQLWPCILPVVFPTPDSNARAEAALHATRDSLNGKVFAPEHRIIASSAAVRRALSETGAHYAALIQAGEVLAPHALAVLADQAAALNHPAVLYADEDRIGPNGRHDPHFKPQPGHALMLSGTLSRGIWLVRRDLLTAYVGETQWAEVLRLDLWLRWYEQHGPEGTHRIPFVLTHRTDEAAAAPPDALAEVVEAHLQRMDLLGDVQRARPLRLQLRPRSDPPKVSVIVPSACRSPHVADCLRAVLQGTRYPSLDLTIVTWQPEPLDGLQQRTIASLTQDPRVRHLHVARPGFNYAAVNNHAAGQVDGALLCLLNDDVSPIGADWLAAMVGHLNDPRAGIVGAKLYYPSHMVQHGGVIMGLGAVCEHANRFLPQGAPGYAWRGVLDQEFSAVTGACLLTRRDLYLALGGMDPAYATAFNDVDYCLRVREAGHSVVFCASAEMIHYESLSFGRHYAHDATERQATETARMRQRWARVCAADPYHNPNLSLRVGDEFGLAVPPRVSFPPAPTRPT